MILGDCSHLASVSENSILNISKATQVSKAAGIDILFGRFLKDVAKVLSKPISDLCNLYFDLPLISKVMEKVIHNQIGTFPNSKNLLCTYQSGFRKQNSTDFCLSYLNGKILKGFDKGLMTGMILIDLQKAFDTIYHDVLLQKLYAIGFSKHIVNWFKSFLSNRSFLVNLGNNFSQPPCVSCGVLQGSILGPLFAFNL